MSSSSISAYSVDQSIVGHDSILSLNSSMIAPARFAVMGGNGFFCLMTMIPGLGQTIDDGLSSIIVRSVVTSVLPREKTTGSISASGFPFKRLGYLWTVHLAAALQAAARLASLRHSSN